MKQVLKPSMSEAKPNMSVVKPIKPENSMAEKLMVVKPRSTENEAGRETKHAGGKTEHIDGNTNQAGKLHGCETKKRRKRSTP